MRAERETDFHNNLAEKNTATYEEIVKYDQKYLYDNLIFINEIGNISNLKILDCGCGDGIIACYLASQGAEVWGFDISDKMILNANRRATIYGLGPRINFKCCSFESADYPSDFFDVVYGNMILHHLEDKSSAIQNVKRILRQGGYAIFRDTSASNPVLNLARNKIIGRFGTKKIGSTDEHPISYEGIEQIRREVDNINHYYPEMFLWRLSGRLFTMPLVRFLPPFSKDIIYNVCSLADRATYHLFPFLRNLSYYSYLKIRRPDEDK